MNYITVAGKKRPVNTGSYMLTQFCEANNLTLEQLEKEFIEVVGKSTKVAISFLFHAFLDGCRVAKQDQDFDEPDVYDWIDAEPEIVTQVYEAFAASLPRPNPDAKKKNVKARR